MKNRLMILELWRFIACITIMLFHSYFLGVEYRTVPFSEGFLYVEFFFIISGYFTFAHFTKINNNSLDSIAKNSIIYTLKKFSYFLPYIIIMVLIMNTYNYVLDKNRGLHSFLDMIREILLISRSDGNVGVLWYLSAMFIVFPLFCCFCQIKSKYFTYIISIFYCIYYYERYVSAVDYPDHLYRALAGLLLGVIVYFFVSIIKQINFSKLGKVIITLIEQGSLILALYFIYSNKEYTLRIIIECFIIGLSIMLSRKSYTANINCKIFGFLGKISFVIYLTHFPIFNIIQTHFSEIAFKYKLLIAVSISIVFSLLLYVLVENIRKYIKLPKVTI